MGWLSGGELADELWATVRNKLPAKQLKKLAREWVNIFESKDCDVMLETTVGEDAGIDHDEELGSHFYWQDQ